MSGLFSFSCEPALPGKDIEMTTCKNCGNTFDDSLDDSELTLCPRCGMDADTFIEWVGDVSYEQCYCDNKQQCAPCKLGISGRA